MKKSVNSNSVCLPQDLITVYSGTEGTKHGGILSAIPLYVFAANWILLY